MLNKPKFWDRKHESFYSLIFLPLTILLILINWLSHFVNKKKFKIKTICVGNIYIGGTGKTPLTIEIFKILKALKQKSVIIKKYYKNQKDEQKLLSKIGPIISRNSRIDSLTLAEKQGYKMAVIDDGLQDKKIDYDLKIVCFDKEVFLGNGKLLPAGPLRENLNSLKNYDVVFFNGVNNLKKEDRDEIKKINNNIEIFETHQKLLNIKKIKKNKNYLVFSGIGNPSNFKSLLLKNKIKVKKTLVYPDHYNYSLNDLKFIENLAKKLKLKIITTEKDYLRINNFEKKNIEFIKMKLEIKRKKSLMQLIKKI